MFLTYKCEAHGEFEMRGGNTPCPNCSVEMKRVYQPPTVRKQFDRRVEGNIPDRAGRARVQGRMGGGKASIQSDVGGYRPMITHQGFCPKEQRYRNVAVLAEFTYGKRVNCEGCSYVWIHQEATAANPLIEGINEAYRPRKMFFMGKDAPTPAHFPEAERGA